MKITIAIITSLLILYSCTNPTDVKSSTSIDTTLNTHVLKPTYKSLLNNTKFDSIVCAFVKGNPCDSCIYEMYIDKVPMKTLITLKVRVYNLEYMTKNNPLYSINYCQKDFYVYSGLEDVFEGDKKLMDYRQDANNKIFHEWGITLDSSRYEVDTTGMSVGIPFYPPVPFIPPVNR